MKEYLLKFIICFFLLVSYVFVHPGLFAQQDERKSEEKGYWKFSHENHFKKDFYIEEKFTIQNLNTSFNSPSINYNYHVQTFGYYKNEKTGIKDYKMKTKTKIDNIPMILLPGNRYSVNFSTEVLNAENPSEHGGPAPHYYVYIFQCKNSVTSVDELEMAASISPPNPELDNLYFFGLSFFHDRFQGNHSHTYDNLIDHIHEKNWEKGIMIERGIPFTPPLYSEGKPEFGLLLLLGDPHRGYSLTWYVYKWHYGEPDDSSNKRIALKSTSVPRQVKLDGQSQVEVNAVLYEYIEGMNESAKPIVGKKVIFNLESQHGIMPGRLTQNSDITDVNGIARTKFIAPDAKSLSGIPNRIINTAVVRAQCNEFQVDDMAYIDFLPDRGEVRVEPPIKGIISDHGIVPPDGRFPALIRALIEDSDLQPLPATAVNVALKGDHTYGMLRAPDGTESKELTLITDGRGLVEFQYFFASNRIPGEAVTETIEIKTAHMSIPLRAKVSIGLNLVFDRVESAYEGRGIINAGENIPLRMRIKDAWYPEIDLSRILSYWGLGVGAGDTRLYPRLEIENLSSIPDYLLDHLRQQRYPEPGFDEMMKVVTFRAETGEIVERNLLYVFESSLRPYGHPQVRPVASGNHYYQARISLVDQHGETIPHARHPATKTYFNLQTDMPADALYIYFVNNPLRPQTPEAEWYAFALDFMGMGTLISVVDAMDAINRGDTEALFDIMFSELKGFFMDQAKDRSPDFKTVMDGYSRITMAKTVLEEIEKSISGVASQLEHQLFSRLATNIDNEKEELIILKGTGDQKLFLTSADEETSGSNRKKGRGLFGGLINIQITGVDEKTQDRISKLIGRKKEAEIPAYENRLHVDKGLGIYSLKSGNVSYFIIPAGLEVDYENATEMLRY